MFTIIFLWFRWHGFFTVVLFQFSSQTSVPTRCGGSSPDVARLPWCSYPHAVWRPLLGLSWCIPTTRRRLFTQGPSYMKRVSTRCFSTSLMLLSSCSGAPTPRPVLMYPDFPVCSLQEAWVWRLFFWIWNKARFVWLRILFDNFIWLNLSWGIVENRIVIKFKLTFLTFI